MRRERKLWLVALVGLLAVLCVGCTQEQSQGEAIEKFGYINGWSESEGQYEIVFDEAEWLTSEENADRLRELDKDPDTLDDGYYINNPEEDTVNLVLADDVKIVMLSFMDWSEMEVDKAGFAEYYDEYLTDISLPFWVTVQDGKVLEIKMQYIP